MLLLLGVGLVGAPRSSLAQGAIRQVNVLGFDPSVNGQGVFSVESAATLRHLQWSVGTTFSYVNDPLVMTSQGTTVYRAVGHQVLLDVTAALGLWKLFEVGLHLPVAMYQAGSSGGTILGERVNALKVGAVGDLRFVPKVRFWSNRASGFGLAIIPQFTVPSGFSSNNAGERTATFEPRIVLDYRFRQGTVLALNMGYRLRKSVETLNLRVGDEFFFGFGVDASVWRRRLSVLGELYGAVGFKDAGRDPDAGIDEEEVPVELVLGLRYRFANGIALMGGAGVGLTHGWSSPDFRVFAGLSFTSLAKAGKRGPVVKARFDERDRDGDTIPNAYDRCPDQAEDMDRFQDSDGCPDPDNDQDGICDPHPVIQKNLKRFQKICRGRDQAPLVAEDRDGFQDEDGVPDPDNDKDGICDPNPTIQKNLARYAKVCRGRDQAPLAAEDRDGFQDEDGVPDPDNDKDGICDPNRTIQKNIRRFKGVCAWRDLCPSNPEDRDGFEDDDGCPDPDNDRDGFCDSNQSIQSRRATFARFCQGKDACDDKPETTNGVADNDGCPDQGKIQVTAGRSKIELPRRIIFQAARISGKSRSILKLVTTLLKNNPWIRKIRIEGHTAQRDAGNKFLYLSLNRANAVKKFLVSQGVSVDRLTVMGFGGSRPARGNCAKLRSQGARRKCRSGNERIDFIIVDRAKVLPGRYRQKTLLEGLFE